MKTFVLFVALSLFVACASASVVEYERLPVPSAWVESRAVPGSHPIRLQIGLKQQNMDLLHDILMSVSDPKSPTYGQHLSLDDLTDIIAPADEDVERVMRWLHANGVNDVKTVVNKDWLIAETTIEVARELLGCKFAYYRNVQTNTRVIRAATSYYLPSHIAEIVDLVAGIHSFPFGRWTPIKEVDPSVLIEGRGKVGGITPTDIYELYNVTVPSASCNCNTTQSVVEFGSANYSPSDLEKFFQEYAPQLSGQVVEQVYGDNNADGLISTEANLDVQYIMALGAFVNTSDYVAPRSPDIIDEYLDYTWYVGNQTSPPLVHSISYGEYGGQYDNSTVQRVSNEFMKMGARGISIFIASGDNGVGCGERCTAQEFDFPSSPYCTMVGATEAATHGGEVGATFSSGGFSRDYWTPSWQADAVNGYFKSGVTLPQISYDRNGRGYPDVSAIGVALEVIVHGRATPVSGTSCSAPVFGGIIALINAQRDLAGKGPLGWINPWVYQNPTMFTDITSGDNSYKCCDGFQAASGWDPVTGMGTPIYPAMLASAMSLP